MEKIICFECATINEYVMRKAIRKYTGEGYAFELEAEVPFCPKCGRALTCESIEEKISEQANEIIRKQRDIITKEEIRDLLEKYNTSQKFLSKLLDWGDITLTRYITGNYTPNLENSNKLKALKNPYVFQSLLNMKDAETGGTIKEEKSFEKAQNKVNSELQRIEREHSKIFTVVNWFLAQSSEELPITHLSLEKLLYFVQSWSVVLNSRRMFENECQAWAHGAVYPKIYETFKSFGYRPLPKVSSEVLLDDSEIEVLNIVKKYYYDVYNPKTLEKICHLECPYKEARKGYLEGQTCQEMIDKEQVEIYYKAIAEKFSISLQDASGIREYLNELLR